MNTYKYKVKINPGTQKRGKARKLIQEIFTKVAQGPPQSTLIKAIPEDQFLLVLPKGCQILAAGLNKIKQKKKQKKKNKG